MAQSTGGDGLASYCREIRALKDRDECATLLPFLKEREGRCHANVLTDRSWLASGTRRLPDADHRTFAEPFGAPTAGTGRLKDIQDDKTRSWRLMGNRFGAMYQQGRPAWMREGTLEVALLEGHEDLEVVGESHRQENLWRVLGGQHRPEVRVRMNVYAMLLAEDGNPYDVNAVSVWIDGLMVGYLPRDQAVRLRPGLLALQERERKPIALEGVIAGGGMRDDGPGRLGVFLCYDREDFGLAAPPTAPDADARLRAALGDDIASSKDSPYNLVWMHGLPDDDIHGIKVLRNALAKESNVIGRHFIYAELEAALYRCRDAFSSALDDYDKVCIQHDDEMDSIRSACINYWGKVPVLDTYRQMAIRLQKRHEYRRALWWAERGITLYGDDAARPEAVNDLRKRAVGYRAKVELKT